MMVEVNKFEFHEKLVLSDEFAHSDGPEMIIRQDRDPSGRWIWPDKDCLVEEVLSNSMNLQATSTIYTRRAEKLKVIWLF